MYKNIVEDQSVKEPFEAEHREWWKTFFRTSVCDTPSAYVETNSAHGVHWDFDLLVQGRFKVGGTHSQDNYVLHAARVAEDTGKKSDIDESRIQKELKNLVADFYDGMGMSTDRGVAWGICYWLPYFDVLLQATGHTYERHRHEIQNQK